MFIAPAQVETADLSEILVDKVHVLGARNRIKERDIFDLWWICSQLNMSAEQAARLFIDNHEAHFAMYPSGMTPEELIASYRERAGVMQRMLDTEPPEGPGLGPMIEGIARWLPSHDSLPNVFITDNAVRVMVTHAIACAHAAADQVQSLLDAPEPEEAAPLRPMKSA